MTMENHLDTIINRIHTDYRPYLLNWARKKLGNSEDAEDLVQEILIKVFTLIPDFDKPEDDNLVNIFIWRIANFTYLKFIQKKSKDTKVVKEAINEVAAMPTPPPVAEIYNLHNLPNIGDNDTLKKVRHKIVRLDYLHREILISFYIDRLSMREIAEKYNIKETAVKRYLFNTREKLKKEVQTMKDTPDFTYRPRKLMITAIGSWGDEFDAVTLQKDSIMQNICLHCLTHSRNISEIAEYLSMPKTFLEPKLDWLVERAFITQKDRQYLTAFPIKDIDFQEKVINIYFNNKAILSDLLIDKIVSRADQIKVIGFHGSEKPINQLLWCLIYHFLYTQLQLFDESKFDTFPLRPDNGRYIPIGEEKVTEGDMINNICGEKYKGVNKWKRVGPVDILADNAKFTWYGIERGAMHPIINYIFKRCDIFSILIGKIFKPDFSYETLSAPEKKVYDEIVQWGWISENNGLNFLIFNADQASKLDNILTEIYTEMKAGFELVKSEITKLCHSYLPSKYVDFEEQLINFTLVDLIFYTTAFAYCDGKLYIPKDENEAALLTTRIDDIS